MVRNQNNRINMAMARFFSLSLAVTSLLVVSSSAKATVIYSENFDSGLVGESLLDPSFNYFVNTDPDFVGSYDMQLGTGVHGWSGLSVVGNNAADGQLNELGKFLDLPTTGLIKFSADLFSSPSGIFACGIRLIHDRFADAGHAETGIVATENEPRIWEAGSFPAPRGLWEGPALADEPVRAAVFFNQDTGENWASITQEGVTLEGTHYFDPAYGKMNGIDLSIDRRYSITGGDIDNLLVEHFNSVPEPSSLEAMSFVGLGVLALSRRRRRLSGPF